MSPAARSLHLFGLYLLPTGIGLMLAPALLLAPLGVAPPQEVWVRVAGMLALFLGLYYTVAAKAELLPFIRLSVWLRGSVIVIFAGFVRLADAPAALLLLGAVDLAAAAWTAMALRGLDKSAASIGLQR